MNTQVSFNLENTKNALLASRNVMDTLFQSFPAKNQIGRSIAHVPISSFLQEAAAMDDVETLMAFLNEDPEKRGALLKRTIAFLNTLDHFDITVKDANEKPIDLLALADDLKNIIDHLDIPQRDRRKKDSVEAYDKGFKNSAASIVLNILRHTGEAGIGFNEIRTAFSAEMAKFPNPSKATIQI